MGNSTLSIHTLRPLSLVSPPAVVGTALGAVGQGAAPPCAASIKCSCIPGLGLSMGCALPIHHQQLHSRHTKPPASSIPNSRIHGFTPCSEHSKAPVPVRSPCVPAAWIRSPSMEGWERHHSLLVKGTEHPSCSSSIPAPSTDPYRWILLCPSPAHPEDQAGLSIPMCQQLHSQLQAGVRACIPALQHQQSQPGSTP